MAYREVRLCSGSGGFEAIPDRPRELDLTAVRKALEAARIPTLDARVMLLATLPPEVTISRSGRLMFKTADERLARQALQRLLALTDLEALPPNRSRGPSR